MSEIADRYFEKALGAIKAHDYEHAATLLAEAIKLKPDFVEAWIVRGNVLDSNDRYLDAMLHYDRALSFDIDKHDAWNNRGISAANMGLWALAEESFRTSAKLLPALEPHMGLANMYCTLMRLDEAAAEYRMAIEHGAGPDAHFNLGVTLLGMGRWEEGFREYWHRWENTPYPPRAYRDYPKWNGENLTGKRILLYGEQGYGDEILALRFAETLAELFNSYVVVEARAPMRRLAESMQTSNLHVVPRNSGKDYHIDYSCPLLDVQAVLKLDWKNVGREHGYLMPPYSPTTDLYDWHERLQKLPPGLNVGLCWQSGSHLNTSQPAHKAKSIPWQWLKPFARPGVNLISLQKPDDEDAKLPLVRWMDECHDFADTAALIGELDLVISVDTAVAHVAGALGKPVWNFVRYSGYWPWLAPDVVGDPEKSIWYSSMRLLRQPSLANWDEPIKRATALLEGLLKKQEAA
jgi:Tfp pilus assembly protein PilF